MCICKIYIYVYISVCHMMIYLVEPPTCKNMRFIKLDHHPQIKGRNLWAPLPFRVLLMAFEKPQIHWFLAKNPQVLENLPK